MRLDPFPRFPEDPAQATRRVTDLFRAVAQQVNAAADGQMVASNNARTSIPTTGTFAKGDFVRKDAPSVTSSGIVVGWLRITDGSSHTLNTDWVELTVPTTEVLKRASFKVRIVNTAGTIQHRITSIGSASDASSFATQITGASTSLTNTPTGADSTTDFAAGAKIGSASPSILWFNTQEQTAAKFGVAASIVFNSSSVALNVVPGILSLNINGTTRTRFLLQFTNATSGAAYDLTTLGAGLIIDAIVDGYME